MSKKNRSLKSILINPKYQLRYIFWLTGTGLILVALNAGLFYSYVSENYQILVDLSPMTDEVKAQLYTELNQVMIKLIGLSLLFLVLVGILGIVFSHRTAGPMFHFKRVFNAVKNGDKSQRVRLRPTDDFQDVAKAFNDMMDKQSQT